MIKKLFALMLCLLLCGCQRIPAQSTEPETSPTDAETQDTVTLDIGLEIASCTVYNAEGKKLVLPENGIIHGDMEYSEIENQAPDPGYLGHTFQFHTAKASLLTLKASLVPNNVFTPAL